MKLQFTFLLLLISRLVSAQSPQSINYQGVVRDQAGVPITTLSSIGIKFAISDGSNAIVHQETQSSVGVNNVGLFNTRIGISPALSSTISWQNGPYTLSVSIDLGSGFTFLGSQQMVSVPFALYAERAGNAQAQNLTLNGNNLSISGGNTVTLPAGGTPTITGTGASTVSSAGNSFTVNTPAVNISSGAGATVSGAFPNYTISGGAGSTPTITGTGANNVITAGNSFTVNAPTVNISGTGGSTVTGAFPNYTVTSLAGVPPTIVGAGASTVTPVGNSFTVNTPAVNIAGVGGSSVSGTFPNFTVSSLAGANPTIVGMGATTVIPVGNSFTVNTPSVSLNGIGGTTVSGIFPNYVVNTPSLLAGDVTGPFGSNTVTALRGFNLAPVTPTPGQILAFTGVWTPTTPPVIPLATWVKNATTVTLATISDFVGINTNAPSSPLHVNGAVRISDGSQAAGYVLTSDNLGNANWQNKNSIVTSIVPPSCQTIPTASTTPLQLGPILGSFTKNNAATFIEVSFQSFINVYNLVGANGVIYELRVDGNPFPNNAGRAVYFKNNGGVFVITANDPMTLRATIAGLPTGPHTLSLWVYTNGGTASGVWYDNGCWSTSNLTVKEFW